MACCFAIDILQPHKSIYKYGGTWADYNSSATHILYSTGDENKENYYLGRNSGLSLTEMEET